MKRRILRPWIVIAIILMIIAGSYVFQKNFVLLEDTVYRRDTQSLSFAQWPIEDQQRLTRFTHLEQIDLLQADISIDQYDKLAWMLPQCEILWQVPFRDRRLPLDTEALTLDTLESTDISVLLHLPNLKTVVLTDMDDPSLITMLRSSLPNCEIKHQYIIGGTVVDQDTTTYAGTNIEDITFLLSLFPQIKLVYAVGCTDYAQLMQLQAKYPDCRICYDVLIGDTHWRENTTNILLESADPQELAAALACLPRVGAVQITQNVPDPFGMQQIAEAYPNIQFSYTFDLFGKTVSPDIESINLSRIKIESAEAFEKYIPLFPNLKKAELCRCGIPNEDMAALKARYPDISIVWEVQIGHAWIRTDVIYFMPYQHRLVLYDHHVDNLKYLTELICLDMGHMKVTRTDYLAYMPKLQYLLMCSTPITDISHCANMKDLKYVELFITKVTDFSPLLECKNLVDLNVSYTNPADPLIFGKMTQLQNLWFRNMKNWDVRNQLRQALPNTTMVFEPGSSTGGGWRKLANYYAQRDIIHMPYMEED